MDRDNVLVKMHKVEIFMSREFIKTNDNKCMKDGPSASQMQIMDYILDNEGNDIYQKDLENVLGLRRATVSGVLMTMEKHGLIKRIISKDDKRNKKIILSKEAKMRFDDGKSKFDELENILFKDLSNKDIKDLDNIINKINKNIINYMERK